MGGTRAGGGPRRRSRIRTRYRRRRHCPFCRGGKTEKLAGQQLVEKPQSQDEGRIQQRQRRGTPRLRPRAYLRLKRRRLNVREGKMKEWWDHGPRKKLKSTRQVGGNE